MPDQAPPPPPPPTPATTYQATPAYPPQSAYPTSSASSSATSSGVKLPAWLDLWTFVGLLVILVGAIFILVGFLFGDAAAGQVGTGGSVSTYQSDFEAFFVWTGVGIFLTILGWLLRVVLGMWRGQKGTAPASSAAPAATTAAAPSAPAASPPLTAPAAAPTTPACANCGQPTTYIPQYGRYYCYSCARYV